SGIEPPRTAGARFVSVTVRPLVVWLYTPETSTVRWSEKDLERPMVVVCVNGVRCLREAVTDSFGADAMKPLLRNCCKAAEAAARPAKLKTCHLERGDEGSTPAFINSSQ